MPSPIPAPGAPPLASPWLDVTQPLVNRFADAISDHQFIHVDPERAARESVFGGTIAHGFLVLSLLSKLGSEVLALPGPGEVAINYGFDKVRFLAPVPVGRRIRGVFKVAAQEPRSGGLLTRFDVTVELEGSAKPALAAEWLVLILKGDKA
ncbi:MaoC family dehydratase [Xanthobacter autotrophicus DSM 431]|uniref:MaoC family dehydratase n=1 Tax=Xanthobacter nonsaccharivorans TaxID=3119912 RepID=UPI0037293397